MTTGEEVRLYVLMALAGTGTGLAVAFVTTTLVDNHRSGKKTWLVKIVRRDDRRHIVGNPLLLFSLVSVVACALTIAYLCHLKTIKDGERSAATLFYFRNLVLLPMCIQLWLATSSNMQSALVSSKSIGEKMILSARGFVFAFSVGSLALFVALLVLDLLGGYEWAVSYQAESTSKAFRDFQIGIAAANGVLSLVILVVNVGGLSLLLTVRRQLKFNAERYRGEYSIHSIGRRLSGIATSGSPSSLLTGSPDSARSDGSTAFGVFTIGEGEHDQDEEGQMEKRDRVSTRRKRVTFDEPGQKPVTPVGRRAAVRPEVKLGRTATKASTSTSRRGLGAAKGQSKALFDKSTLAKFKASFARRPNSEDTQSIASMSTGTTGGSSDSAKRAAAARPTGRRAGPITTTLISAAPPGAGILNSHNSRSILAEGLALPSLTVVLSPLSSHAGTGTNDDEAEGVDATGSTVRGRRAIQPTREGLLTAPGEASESDAMIVLDEVVTQAIVQPFKETALPDDPAFSVARLKETIANADGGEPPQQRETAQKILSLRRVESEVVAIICWATALSLSFLVGSIWNAVHADRIASDSVVRELELTLLTWLYLTTTVVTTAYLLYNLIVHGTYGFGSGARAGMEGVYTVTGSHFRRAASVPTGMTGVTVEVVVSESVEL